jgi:basic membrane lipoprotein Med (substrate-binding protein (PBP1-ABC) superfamily)
VIATRANLSGIGAMREACRRGASVVALDTDAWLLVPDVNACLLTSVRKLYDVAIASAIRRYSDGLEVPGLVLSDVAGGGIGLSDFHVAIPAGVTARLDRVVGDMRVGPPRPTVAPSAEASGAIVVPSSEPSGATAVPNGS